MSRPRKSVCAPPSRATWCCRRSTLATRRARRCGWPTWVCRAIWSPTRSRRSWRSACSASTANPATSRASPTRRKCNGCAPSGAIRPPGGSWPGAVASTATAAAMRGESGSTKCSKWTTSSRRLPTRTTPAVSSRRPSSGWRATCCGIRLPGSRSRARPRSPKPCASPRSSKTSAARVPFFAYTGRNARGELVRGVLENSDSGAVADQLITSGVSPIDISPTAGPQALAAEGWLRRLSTERVTLEDMVLFSRQMYTLLKAGVPLLKSLAALQESATRIGFANMLQDVRTSLDSGRDLSTAMRRHPKAFGPFYISMVRVGELTGALEEVFLRLFNHLEFEREIKSQVATALRYPIFVIVVMGVAIVIVNVFVIPAFARIFAGFKAELPLMTRVLLGFSDFMVNYWPALLGLVAGAYVVFRVWVGTPAGRYSWDRMKLRIPIAGKIVLKATLARFARSLSIALKSGVPIVQSLSVVEQVVDNAYVG